MSKPFMGSKAVDVFGKLMQGCFSYLSEHLNANFLEQEMIDFFSEVVQYLFFLCI